MSASSAHASAFFRDVVRYRTVWWVRDDEGSPTPLVESGEYAMPFWSSQPRAQRAVNVWGPQFRSVSMTLDFWCDVVLPDLAEDGVRVGINWTGPWLVGWDFTVAEVSNRLAFAFGDSQYDR